MRRGSWTGNVSWWGGGESYVPPIGGKRMERRQRKQSVPHIMKVAVELNVVLG